MIRRFGKMGGASSSLPSNSSLAPPISKYTKIDCEKAPQSFNSDNGDKLYDGEDATPNPPNKFINPGGA